MLFLFPLQKGKQPEWGRCPGRASELQRSQVVQEAELFHSWVKQLFVPEMSQNCPGSHALVQSCSSPLAHKGRQASSRIEIGKITHFSVLGKMIFKKGQK